MSPREWDAASYDRMSDPQLAMARDVIDRLDLRGDERVLDVGCGSGRVTAELLARVPRGTVVGMDGSQAMVDQARERLGDRVELFAADAVELEVREPFDAILSTATFHWIGDHPRLFARLHAALRPGGRLVAQCGGKGNIDVLRGHAREVLAREPYAAHFVDWTPPWNYAAPQETEQRLRAAGFVEARCWLQPAPREPEHPREFLATIVLGPHVQQLPEQLREPFMDDVLASVGEP